MAKRRDIDVWISLRPSSARALNGFLPAIAAAAGVEESSLRSWDAIRAAAETIKSQHARPDGPAKLSPVGQAVTRNKRHPEAIAIASPDDAIRLAHDFLAINGRLHAQVEKSFRTELAAMQATPAGRRHLLRTRRNPAKFSKDPVENDRLTAEWTALRESVRPQLLAGDGANFDAAIHYPHGDLALVLRSRDPVSLGTVEIPAGLTATAASAAISKQIAEGNYVAFSLDKAGAAAENAYIERVKGFAQIAYDSGADFFKRAFADQPSYFRTQALKSSLSSSFWNGNAQGELQIIGRMPAGARKLLHILRTPRDHDGAGYSRSLTERSYLLFGLDAAGIQRMNQAFQLAPVLPARIRDISAEKLSATGMIQTIVAGAPLRKTLEQCALSMDAHPPLTAPGYLRSLAHLRSFPRIATMADHTALALYFHARPQAAPFSPTAFAKDRISGDTKFGAAVQLAGFEFMRSLSDAAGDPATLLRQAEVLARAVDMRRLPTGGVSHKARTLDRHVRRDSHRWLANAIAAIAGGPLRGPTDAPAALLMASSLLMPRGRTEKAFNEMNELVHKQMVRSEPARASLEAQFTLENRPAAPNGAQVEPFPHFFRAAAEINGVVLEPLRSHERLIAEGSDLRHCVGGYRHDAQAGHTMIVGISSAEGRSTAEIQLVAGELDAGLQAKPPHLAVVQHRSYGNIDPSPAHAAALSRLLERTESVEAKNAPRPEDRHAALDRWTKDARSHFKRSREISFTAEQQDRYRDLLFEQIKPFLSRPEREMTRTQWVEKAGPARLAGLNPVRQAQKAQAQLSR
ncbi:MAG: PcfJ domain-containing protein [Methylobacteriaceae bacterium]|nr:PcfJ domain-containing protein [Methylobacteriaceae bacterium]